MANDHVIDASHNTPECKHGKCSFTYCEDCAAALSDSFNSVISEQKQAQHHDEGKPGMQYVLSMPGLMEVAYVGDFGAKKYGQWNYRAGMPWMKLLGSCSRHLAQFIIGQDNDMESGISHLAHLAYNALMLLGYVMEGKGKDDRFKE